MALIASVAGHHHPRRAAGLEISDAADGSVVYDRSRERVHYLNPTAALVLELCTGERSEAEIARWLQQVYELGEPPVAEVADSLARFRTEGLIG